MKCYLWEGDFLCSSRSRNIYILFSICSVIHNHFEDGTKAVVCKITASLFSEIEKRIQVALGVCFHRQSQTVSYLTSVTCAQFYPSLTLASSNKTEK